MTKYNACVLGIVGKAFKAGTTVGSSKCNAILIDDTSARKQLRRKARDQVRRGLPHLGRSGYPQYQDDAFVNDIIYGLIGNGDMATQRCTGNTSVHCTSTAPDCTVAGGTCECFVGAPLPLAAGGSRAA